MLQCEPPQDRARAGRNRHFEPGRRGRDPGDDQDGARAWIGIMAEGLETEEQRQLFLDSGVPSQAQGFYFSRAVDAASASDLLRAQFIKPKTADGGTAPGLTAKSDSGKVALRA
jgi:hypothetical protein